MSDNTNSSSPVTGSEEASSVATATTTSATGAKPQPTSSTMVSNMEQLRTEYPDLYNKILQSMAQNMCIQINRGNNRLLEEMKKLRREGNS